MDKKISCECRSSHEIKTATTRKTSDVNICLYGPNQEEGRTDLVCLFDSGRENKCANRIRIYGTEQGKSGISICVCGRDVNSSAAKTPSRERTSINISSFGENKTCLCGGSADGSRSREKTSVNMSRFGENKTCLSGGNRSPSRERTSVNMSSFEKNKSCLCGASDSRSRTCLCGASDSRSRTCLCSKKESTTDVESDWKSETCFCTEDKSPKLHIRKKSPYNRSSLDPNMEHTLSPKPRVLYEETTLNSQQQLPYVDIRKAADWIEMPGWNPYPQEPRPTSSPSRGWNRYPQELRPRSSPSRNKTRICTSPTPNRSRAAVSATSSKKSLSRSSSSRTSFSHWPSDMPSSTRVQSNRTISSEKLPTPVSFHHKSICMPSTNMSATSTKSRKTSPKTFTKLYSNKSICMPTSFTSETLPCTSSEELPTAVSSHKSINRSAYSTKSKKSQRSIQIPCPADEPIHQAEECKCCTCLQEHKRKSQRKRVRSAKTCPAAQERPNYFKLYCNHTF